MSYDVRKAFNSEGNWRFKGLAAAAFGGPSVQRQLGKRWPSGTKSDYRFLSQEQRNDPITAPGRGYNPTMFEGGESSRELQVAKEHLPASDMRDLEDGEAVDMDRYIKRALLNEDITELDVLYRESLLDTVIRGAQPYQIAREAATVMNVGTRKGDVPRGSSRIYAPKVAQGAEIKTDEENYDTVEYNCEKYALGFGITDELVDETSVDVVERQIEFTGAAVENALNRIFVNEIVDNAGNEFDTAGAGQDVSMVNRAQEEIEKANFGAGNTLVMHPEFKTALFEDSNLAYANRANSDDVITDRTYNQLLGAMLMTGSPDAYDAGNQTWGFNADGEIGAVVYNDQFMGLQIYQDLTTKQFEDPITDITGGNVRAHFDANYHQPDAAARIEY